MNEKECGCSGDVPAEIYNSVGELVTVLQADVTGVDNAYYRWNTSVFAPGIYFIRINSPGGIISARVNVIK